MPDFFFVLVPVLFLRIKPTSTWKERKINIEIKLVKSNFSLPSSLISLAPFDNCVPSDVVDGLD